MASWARRSNRRGGRLIVGVASGALLVLLSGFAVVVRISQTDARQALTDRLSGRAVLTADFARGYVDDLAARERRQAVRLLGGEVVSEATFDQVAQAFDFDAAVLLDRDGRLLSVWPNKPSILGDDMTVAKGREHLRTAVFEGRLGVSGLVPSAARAVPVAAVAVPFQTRFGRRVISGAFSPSTTPLGAYFASVTSVAGSNAFLIDASGHVLVAGHDDPVARRVLPTVRLGVHDTNAAGPRLTVAVAAVAGAPWRVVITTPTTAWYAPVSNGRWAPWALLAAFAMAGLIATILLFRLNRARASAAETARTDTLTGLPNRRAMEESLKRAAAYAARHGGTLVALMIDLDHFKAVNDSRGHDGGDIVLRAAAANIRDAVRTEDISGRWGGEEFLVLLPQTDLHGGLLVAERIRAAIAAADTPDDVTSVTASIGLAALHEGPGALLLDADAALYEAKAAGRNRTTVASGQHAGASPTLAAP